MTGRGGKRSTSWKPGQSGNPRGRPPKTRALTEILKRAGSSTMEYEGKRISGKRLMAMLLWQVVKTGTVTMPDGTVIKADFDDWFSVVKFIYQHVDGPPPKVVDLNADIKAHVQSLDLTRFDDAELDTLAQLARRIKAD